MPNDISVKQLQEANDALVAYGRAKTFPDMARVLRDNRDTFLSDAALVVVEQRIAELKANGNNAGADELAKFFYGLRSRLESPDFKEWVHREIARDRG
jgi:hypothetical protein